jgi:hypothetical protein
MLPQSLILGILVFQILYPLVQWYFFRRKEYLYYTTYCIVIGFYFFLKYLVVNDEIYIGSFHFHQKILDRDLVFVAICFYIQFGRLFVNSAQLFLALDRKRMDYLGGTIYINNTKGTSIYFSIPIANLKFDFF